MIEAFIYSVLQSLGYRRYHFDRAFAMGINLDSFSGWFWEPRKPKGTYRETQKGYIYAGYGVDK